MTPILFPPSTWQVLTDDSERGSRSKSKGTVHRQGALHVFQGTVGRVEGRRGPVGFVTAKLNHSLDLSPHEGWVLNVSCNRPLTVLRFYLQDLRAREEGYSFQFPFQAALEPTEVKINFSDLEPVRRGRSFRAEPDLSTVRTVGFTVRRSVQVSEVRNGPPLNFEIHFEGRGPLGQPS